MNNNIPYNSLEKQLFSILTEASLMKLLLRPKKNAPVPVLTLEFDMCTSEKRSANTCAGALQIFKTLVVAFQRAASRI